MKKIADLLFPISSTNECGKDLRYEHIYDQVKEHRREDDQSLSQGVWQTEHKKANWSEVERICLDLLGTKTKDLQIAMWLLEAWTRLDGFDGLNQGILLIKLMCEKFWDGMYPVIDWENRSFTHRLSPFYFFSEKITEKIVLIPLIDPIDGIASSYTLSDWMMARHSLKTKNKNGLSFKQIRKSIVATPVKFFEDLISKTTSLIDNLETLNKILNEKCGSEAPSFYNVFTTLEDIKRISSKNLVERQNQAKEEEKKHSEKQENLPNGDADVDENQDTKQADTINIEQAYATLREISVFLEKQQPQSPAATLIKIADVIGKKTFQELLEINMKSGTSVMHTISELYKILNTNQPGT
jgi:type VI secretion system protein ImpA